MTTIKSAILWDEVPGVAQALATDGWPWLVRAPNSRWHAVFGMWQLATPGHYDIFHAYSDDFLSWTVHQISVDANPDDATWDAGIMVDSSGRVYMVCELYAWNIAGPNWRHQIHCYYSDDHGVTWNGPEVVDTWDVPNHSAQSRPSLAVDLNDNLHVIYHFAWPALTTRHAIRAHGAGGWGAPALIPGVVEHGFFHFDDTNVGHLDWSTGTGGDLYYKPYAGGAWGADVLIYSGADYNYSAGVVAAQNGDVHIVYERTPPVSWWLSSRVGGVWQPSSQLMGLEFHPLFNTDQSLALREVDAASGVPGLVRYWHGTPWTQEPWQAPVNYEWSGRWPPMGYNLPKIGSSHPCLLPKGQIAELVELNHLVTGDYAIGVYWLDYGLGAAPLTKPSVVTLPATGVT